MKTKILFILSVLFLNIFASCTDDDVDVIKVNTINYSTTEYTVLSGEGGQSVKAVTTPEDAIVKFSIESIKLGETDFANAKEDFMISETGMVTVDENNELEEGVYTVNVKAVNAHDEENTVSSTLIFKIVMLRDLQSVTYSSEKYSLEKGNALEIEAPVIDPQGITLINEIKVFKDNEKIESSEITIDAQGKISIAGNNTLEVGTYSLEVKMTNEYDTSDQLLVYLILTVYEKVESITYDPSIADIVANEEFTFTAPVIVNNEAEVTFSIEKVEKDGEAFTYESTHFNIDAITGELKVLQQNGLDAGTYQLTVAAVNDVNAENKVTTELTLNVAEAVNENAPDFYYEPLPYYIDKGSEVITEKPRFKIAGEYEFSIVSIINGGDAMMGESIETDAISIDDEGRVTVIANHNIEANLNESYGKFCTVTISATSAENTYQTDLFLLTDEAEMYSAGYEDAYSMGGLDIIAGKEYVFEDFRCIPNNFGDMTFEWADECAIGADGSEEKIDPTAAYGITLDPETGKIVIPEGNDLPTSWSVSGMGGNYEAVPMLDLVVIVKYGSGRRTFTTGTNFIINKPDTDNSGM